MSSTHKAWEKYNTLKKETPDLTFTLRSDVTFSEKLTEEETLSLIKDLIDVKCLLQKIGGTYYKLVIDALNLIYFNIIVTSDIDGSKVPISREENISTIWETYNDRGHISLDEDLISMMQDVVDIQKILEKVNETYFKLVSFRLIHEWMSLKNIAAARGILNHPRF